MNRRWSRWLPAVVAPVVIAAGALAATAATDVDLPSKTPEQVLTLVGEGSLHAFSGTVEQKSELGLPELPSGSKFGGSAEDAPTGSPSAGSGLTSTGVASALELLSGQHTARIYVDGPQKVRVQLMDSLAERDLIRNGTDVWWYDSAHKAATHVTLPAESKAGDFTDNPGATVQTPAALAKKLLAHLTPSTKVTVGNDTRVAGRDAYDLKLTPQSDDTLVASVSIAVDGKTGLPLSVEVNARGQRDPAFSVAFTSLSTEQPSADRFTFTPPTGTKVTEQTVPLEAIHDKVMPNTATTPGAQHPRPQVTGSGWATIVELPTGSIPSALLKSPILTQATAQVDGGRLLSTSLVNVLVTDDGRAFVGSVTPQALQAAAARQVATQ